MDIDPQKGLSFFYTSFLENRTESIQRSQTTASTQKSRCTKDLPLYNGIYMKHSIDADETLP